MSRTLLVNLPRLANEKDERDLPRLKPCISLTFPVIRCIKIVTLWLAFKLARLFSAEGGP